MNYTLLQRCENAYTQGYWCTPLKMLIKSRKLEWNIWKFRYSSNFLCPFVEIQGNNTLAPKFSSGLRLSIWNNQEQTNSSQLPNFEDIIITRYYKKNLNVFLPFWKKEPTFSTGILTFLPVWLNQIYPPTNFQGVEF